MSYITKSSINANRVTLQIKQHILLCRVKIVQYGAMTGN